jgi:DNA-binding LacI/PurR family transcriptional regulator
MRHVTIKDVAKALNCSISTVSRALNDKYDIRYDTREKILKVAKEMGYSPNPIARKLTQKQSFNIGVIVPEFINSFFPEAIIGMQQIFAKKGYQVLIMQSNEIYENELQNLKTLVDNFVDGIIISLTKETENIDFLSQLIERNYPIVLFNRVNDSLPVSKVVFDDYKMSFFATEHLISQGKKNLIHLSGPDYLSLSENRKNGFLDACKKHKIIVSKEQVIETKFLLKDGERIVKRLHENKEMPEGFVCVNDPTAIGVIKRLKKYGYRIPTDVAVIGFSETPMAALIEPSLSSVKQPLQLMGAKVAEILLEQIESKNFVLPKTVVMNGELNFRTSSINTL